jgi:hypothetical protein
MLNISICATNTRLEYKTMSVPYPEVVRAKNSYAESLYAKVRHAIPAIEWPVHAKTSTPSRR